MGKPSDCQDETWEELGKYKNGSNYGFPIETCPAPEPEDSDDDDGLTEPDVSDENVEVNEPDDSDEIDGETELTDCSQALISSYHIPDFNNYILIFFTPLKSLL